MEKASIIDEMNPIPEKFCITNWSSNADIDVSTSSIDTNLTGPKKSDGITPDEKGFYLALHPDGVPGIVKVEFLNNVIGNVLVTNIGYNPVYVKRIIPSLENTALKIWGGR